MESWQVQSFEFVWFFSGLPHVQIQDLFKLAAGQLPASSGTQQGGQGTVSFAMGPAGTTNFNLQLFPGRINLTLTPANASVDQERFPLFDAIDPTLSMSLQGVKELSTALPGTFRVALVTKLAHEEPSVGEANSRILSLLDARLSLGDFTDLAFQVNKRKDLEALSGQSYNRLIRWASETFQLVSFQVPQVGVPVPAPVLKVRNFATVQVDLNTVPALATQLSPSQQAVIFDELSAELIRFNSNPTPSFLEG